MEIKGSFICFIRVFTRLLLQKQSFLLQYWFVEMKKNGKGKPAPTKNNKEPHLLQQITATKPVIKPAKEETKEEEEEFECKYGIFCAHLRAAGNCGFPHRRHHYLLLNLVPPADHLPDLPEDEEVGKVSKKERKERKILEKTIKQHIDVDALTKQEQLNKETLAAQIKQGFLQNMNEVERQVAEVVTAQTAEEYFAKLNLAKQGGNLFELKRRTMIQLKKKSEKVHADIIDKEYRIAHRLIKEAGKNSKQSLLEIYEDINHNTIPSVREFFEAYLQPHQGVLHEDQTQKCHLSALLQSIFFRDASQVKFQYSLLKHKSPLSDIISNIEFYNLVVPFLHAQAQPFNRYILIDCQQDLSLDSASRLLAKDYGLTFHVKCKPAPEFPFGQLAANLQKFAQWATKTTSKYREPNKDSNVVLILNSIEQIFANPNAQEFQQEKLKERRETFRRLIKILQPVVYFLTASTSKQVKAAVSELLQLQNGAASKFNGSLQVMEQK